MTRVYTKLTQFAKIDLIIIPILHQGGPLQAGLRPRQRRHRPEQREALLLGLHQDEGHGHHPPRAGRLGGGQGPQGALGPAGWHFNSIMFFQTIKIHRDIEIE